MNKFLSLFRLRFIVNLQYRAAAYAGVFTQIFFGLVMVMIYEGFFSGTDNPMPMTLEQTITYIWLGQGLLSLIPWNGDREVQGMIRRGDVVYELVRPMDLYEFWYARMLALRLAPVTLRSLPLFLTVSLILPKEIRISAPADMAHFMAFALVLIGAVFLGCAISNLITIGTLFTIGDGLDRLFPALIMFFSGLVIPLSFFPDWAQGFLRFLPFSGLMDTPYKLYLGIYDITQVPSALIHQVIWTLILVLLGKWLIIKASHRIVIQGG